MTVNSTTENLVQVFCGVRGYEEDGVAYLHIEDSARGLGFEKTENKNGVEYNSIRWAIVEGYLKDFGFRQEGVENGKPHDYYIPENIFYRLCMKAKNEVAEKFQAKVADEIIPSIRKTGSYSVAQAQAQPTIFDYARALIAEKERSDALEAQNKALQAERDETKALLAEEKEKSDYLERTKSWINDKKVATAMGTAGAKSKECERLKKEVCKLEMEIDAQMPTIRESIRKEYEDFWTTARDWCFKHKLPVYADEPKWTVSNLLADICMAHPNREQWHMNAYGVRLFPKWACDILDKMYDEDETFLREYRTV